MTERHTQIDDFSSWNGVSPALEAAGLKREPEPLGIVPTARSFDEGLSIPWTSDTFYYTMSDSDLL